MRVRVRFSFKKGNIKYKKERKMREKQVKYGEKLKFFKTFLKGHSFGCYFSAQEKSRIGTVESIFQ